MGIKLLVDIATLLSVLVAISGLGIGIRTYKRQANTDVFLEYTSRYEQIMNSFPSSARKARLYQGQLPKRSEQLSLAVLRYLNLCSEEYYLWKRGYLAKDVWLIWKDELEKTLMSPLFRREWRELRNEFTSYREFLKFVDEIQNRR